MSTSSHECSYMALWLLHPSRDSAWDLPRALVNCKPKGPVLPTDLAPPSLTIIAGLSKRQHVLGWVDDRE
jgi:hypothetical protein